ncbi:MAG: PilZ domain-containing protein [Gammaproteobacteria bacterium]|nr:PilZ domain-containing protein [Gammaproteobacteria bacterium]
MTETPKTLRRNHERLNVGLPVKLESGSGQTWNVSASGIYFETNIELAQGSPINLEIELHSPDGKLALKVQGSVVRIEQLGGKIGVAISIAESVLETVPEHAP